MKPENFKFKTVKNFLKDVAVTIRILKQLRKQEQNQHLGSFSPEAIEKAKKESLYSLRFQARHYHIAYSEFKGKTRNQIENKAEKKPDESLIQSIKDAMMKDDPPIMPANPVMPEVIANA